MPDSSLDRVRFVLCDLDGVVWLAHQPIPGAPEAIARMRASGRRVLFVTNNSMSVVADHEAALATIGIPANGDVISSAQAAAMLVEPDQRVLVAGGPGVIEAVEARCGLVETSEAMDVDVDVVVVGLHRHFDYDGLTRASRAIRRGARFVATNDDATFPTPDGFTPGAGSIVAAVAAAAGQPPEIAGKPHRPMAALARDRCGPDFGPETALMIGDRWSTDGLFAATLGCRFALVRTGVAAPGAVVDGAPDIDVADLASVADLIV